MQANAERTVKIDRASCASEGERTDPGRRDGGRRSHTREFRKIDGAEVAAGPETMLGVGPYYELHTYYLDFTVKRTTGPEH